MLVARKACVRSAGVRSAFRQTRVRSATVFGLLLVSGTLPASRAFADLDLRCTPQTSTAKSPADGAKPFDITVNDDGTVTKGDTLFSNRVANGLVELRANVTGKEISYGISYAGVSVDTTIDRISGHFIMKATGSYQGQPADATTTGTCEWLFVPTKF